MEIFPKEELNEIKFIRMNTGDDIITKISKMVKIDNGKTQYYLVNPLKIVYSVRQSTPSADALVITLVQWIYEHVSENQNFSIDEDNIVTLANPSKDMLDYYTEAIAKYNKRKENSGRLTDAASFKAREESPPDSLDELTDEELDALNKILQEMLPNKSKLH